MKTGERYVLFQVDEIFFFNILCDNKIFMFSRFALYHVGWKYFTNDLISSATQESTA